MLNRLVYSRWFVVPCAGMRSLLVAACVWGGNAWLFDAVSQSENDAAFGRKQGAALSLDDAASASTATTAPAATARLSMTLNMDHSHWNNNVVFASSPTPYAGCFKKTDDTGDEGVWFTSSTELVLVWNAYGRETLSTVGAAL